MQNSNVVTADELASELGVHPETIRRYCRRYFPQARIALNARVVRYDRAAALSALSHQKLQKRRAE